MEILRHGSQTLSGSTVCRWPSSYQKMVYFAASQAEECQLKISSLHFTESGEHKVKFDTLMVATGISSKWVDQMNTMFDA